MSTSDQPSPRANLAELCSILSFQFDCPYGTVYQYARSLQEAGMLPKSRGRAIALLDEYHVLYLFLALCFREKYSDTPATLKRYINLKHAHVPESAPDRLKITFIERLRLSFLFVIAPEKYLPAEYANERHIERDLRYDLDLKEPEVAVWDSSASIVETFSSKVLPGRMTKCLRHSLSFSCWIFDEFEELFEYPEGNVKKLLDEYEKYQELDKYI